jgi:hypothetical protein
MVWPDAITDVTASIVRRTDCETNHSDQAPRARPFDTKVVLPTRAHQRLAMDTAEELLLFGFALDGFIRHVPEKRCIRTPCERGGCIGGGIHLSKSHPISDEGHGVEVRILHRSYFDAELIGRCLPNPESGRPIDRTFSSVCGHWAHRLPDPVLSAAILGAQAARSVALHALGPNPVLR